MAFTPVTAVKDLAAALEHTELLDPAVRARMLRGAVPGHYFTRTGPRG